jgi:hypothetical protein
MAKEVDLEYTYLNKKCVRGGRVCLEKQFN